MIIFKLISIFVLANLSTCQLTYNRPQYTHDYAPPEISFTVSPESQTNQDVPPILSFQPPKPEAPRPFFIPEPSDSMKPPAENSPIMNFQDYQDVPSEDLVLPSEERWNANNEQVYFYPVEKLTTNTPTTNFPKKYNKNSEKVKPTTLKTKEVLANLEAVVKQKNLEKIIDTIEKQENRKRLEAEKAAAQQKVNTASDAEGAESGFFGLSALDNSNHAQGISQNGERMEFQMHGHNGPHTYKWGYDTGKGHNRQFRLEERDKEGHVRGHYGYYDKSGKLRLVHYEADPHDGFHAETNFEHK